MKNNDTEYFKKLLLELRAEIIEQLEETEEDLSLNVKDASGEHSSYSFHLADMGTDTMEREKAFWLASLDSQVVHEINNALEKIVRGDYGVCEVCGETINRERLEAIPHTRLCLECKSHDEIANL